MSDDHSMDLRTERILQLDVPIIVRLGEKMIPLGEVLGLTPGTIIELPKPAEAELELLVNNKVIGTGAAVKVGENFGLRVSFIGDVFTRIEALGEPNQADPTRPIEGDDPPEQPANSPDPASP